MNRYDIMRAAFDDELQKIAGEMTGHVRSGRRPIGVDRLLERESESDDMPSEVFGTEKVSSPAQAVRAAGAAAHSGVGKYVLPMVAGAGVYHVGRQANEDRRVGKMMRMQQGQ